MELSRQVPECGATAMSAGHCQLLTDHEVDLALCSELEGLADRLPDICSDPQLRKLSERLRAAAERWNDVEMARRLAALGVHPEFRFMDSIHADDLCDMLWRYWRDRCPDRSECLAYMLRALFDGRRRAIAIERLALGCSACQSSEID